MQLPNTSLAPVVVVDGRWTTSVAVGEPYGVRDIAQPSTAGWVPRARGRHSDSARRDWRDGCTQVVDT